MKSSSGMLVLIGILITITSSLVFYNLGFEEGKNSNKRKLATCLFELNQLKPK